VLEFFQTYFEIEVDIKTGAHIHNGFPVLVHPVANAQQNLMASEHSDNCSILYVFSGPFQRDIRMFVARIETYDSAASVPVLFSNVGALQEPYPGLDVDYDLSVFRNRMVLKVVVNIQAIFNILPKQEQKDEKGFIILNVVLCN